jgi:hypothetical protein
MAMPMPSSRPSGSPRRWRSRRASRPIASTALEGLRIVAGIEVSLGDVVERHLLRPHQAAHAQLRGLDAKVARQRVEGHLERKADAGARDAAIGQNRRLVGCDGIRAAVIVREVVEAGENAADLPRFEARRERVSGIGTGVDRCLAVEPEQAAVAVCVGGQAVMVLAAVRARGEVLAPILYPAQRMAEL